jgi:hypothetical protein
VYSAWASPRGRWNMCKLLFRLCFFVAFVLILAGCGGGGSHSSTTSPPDQNPLPVYSNTNLNGTYILTATGANFLGNEAIAAQFTANGQGQLTAGTLLTNTFGNGTQVVDTTFTGNYSVQSDGRSTATFIPATGDGLKIQFVITATGISLIRFDNLGVASGAILKQDASVSSVNGRFVYNLDGWLTINGQFYEQHSVGSLTFNNSEASTTRDIVRIGSNTPVATSEDSIGSFTLSGNGIGTATLTGPVSTLRLRLFFVSADRAIVMTDTEGKLFAGIAERQTSTGNTGSNSILNGNYIFLTQGMDYGSFSQQWVGIGRMTADGNGIINGVRDTSGLMTNDVNAPFTATYSMIADGHGTMTILGGPQLAIYTISSDKALMVGSGQNTYTWGVLQKQSAGPFSTGAVTGKFGLMMGGGPTYVSGIWNANGSGSLTGTVDFYNNGTLTNAQPITGTYQVDSTGRGTGTVVASAVGLGINSTFYVVSQNEVWMMATEPSLVLGRAYKQ